MGYRPVILIKEDTVKHLDSCLDAARFLSVDKNDIYYAISNNTTVLGWTIVDDEEKGRSSFKDDQRPLFHPRKRLTWEEDVRVKEIFTRKPFSSTGFWDKKEVNRDS